MLLPGGLIRGAARKRRVDLKPPDGWLELALAPQTIPRQSLPWRVSAAIVAAVDHLEGETVTLEMAGALCVADRQFLMHRIAELVGMDSFWRSADCHACKTRFDFPLRLGDLPV